MVYAPTRQITSGIGVAGLYRNPRTLRRIFKWNHLFFRTRPFLRGDLHSPSGKWKHVLKRYEMKIKNRKLNVSTRYSSTKTKVTDCIDNSGHYSKQCERVLGAIAGSWTAQTTTQMHQTKEQSLNSERVPVWLVHAVYTRCMVTT